MRPEWDGLPNKEEANQQLSAVADVFNCYPFDCQAYQAVTEWSQLLLPYSSDPDSWRDFLICAGLIHSGAQKHEDDCAYFELSAHPC